jgi:hypothetical protein
LTALEVSGAIDKLTDGRTREEIGKGEALSESALGGDTNDRLLALRREAAVCQLYSYPAFTTETHLRGPIMDGRGGRALWP